MEIDYNALLTAVSGAFIGYVIGMHEGIRMCKSIVLSASGAVMSQVFSSIHNNFMKHQSSEEREEVCQSKSRNES